MTSRRLTAVLGRSVDCYKCHRPVPEGLQYWLTDDGTLCDRCWQDPPMTSGTKVENAIMGVMFMLCMAIIVIVWVMFL